MEQPSTDFLLVPSREKVVLLLILEFTFLEVRVTREKVTVLEQWL